MKKYIYGIDVGGTTVKIGLFSKDKTLLEKWEIPTDTSNNGMNIIDDIFAAIITKTPELNEVIGYGFGIPGPVVENNVPSCVNLGWENVNLKNLLKERLDNENIFVGNDANVAALGEAAFGAGHGLMNVVMMTLGTGVGSGFVVNGEVVEGSNGAAGEIGHLTVPSSNNIRCNCGKMDCLETVSSATGFRRVYEIMKEDYEGTSTLLDFETPSAKAIFDHAKAGDDLANKVVDYSTGFIGYACHIISITTNPSVIVIGGGVSKAGDFLIEKINDAFNSYLFEPCANTKIVIANLGNDAGIYGGLQLVINHG